MTQIIATNNWWWKWGGGWEGDMLKSVYDPQNIGKDAFDYDNFTNTPTIPVVPTEVSAFDNDAWYITSSDLPDLSGYQLKSNLVTNLTSPDDTHYPSAKAVSDAITSAWGWDMLKATYDPNNIWKDAFDYDNFINTPTIPAAQIQSDWNEADNTKADYIKNKPTIPAAQVNSDWNANSWVAQILNKPTIPTVNNPTITIQKNWTKVEDFTLNQSSWETINITVPTKVSDLSNDSWFITGITSWDVTTALWYTPANDTDVVKTSWNQTINWTKTFWTSPVVPSKTTAATNTWTAIATEAQVYTVQGWVDTINGKISSAASSSNKLVDKNYVDDSINSVTAYYITKNAAGDQFATYAELAAATTFYSGGVARVPTRNDYTIVLDDENHSHATTRYIYNNGWEYQYTVNETPLTQAQLNALNSGITAGKVSTYDWYATSKQDKLESWNNIKTINNTSILGGWNISVQPTLINQSNIKSVNWNSLLWSGNLVLYTSIQITLSSAWWTDLEQTVTATWVTASNTVIVSPDPTSISDYAWSMVYCSEQWSNSLTFACSSDPENDITVNVLIMN